MEITTIALLTLLLAIGAGTAAEAQATRWQTLDAEAASLQKQGRDHRALAAEKKGGAGRRASPRPGSSRRCHQREQPRTDVRSQGRYAEAKLLYQRALAIWEKALGPDRPEVATGL